MYGQWRIRRLVCLPHNPRRPIPSRRAGFVGHLWNQRPGLVAPRIETLFHERGAQPMVISDAAVMDLQRQRDRIGQALMAFRDRLRSLFIRRDTVETAMQVTTGLEVALAEPGPEPPAEEPLPPSIANRISLQRRLIARPHPPVLTPEERRGREAAVRGLIFARQQDYSAATEAFTEAACDPRIDLSTVPTFWQLSRAGQEAAVRAYEEVGRVRDAATLDATIRHTFTPRPVPDRRSRVASVT